MPAVFDLSEFTGAVSTEEAAFLARCAASVAAGVIVEVGSWRGRSAIALALGSLRIPEPRRPLVYCIEPHLPATGVYGGRFGPQDRVAFYDAMVRAGCGEQVALVGLPSARAARAFDREVGLLFIDGDHSDDGVAADVEAWLPKLLPGGRVLFDDALDPEVGPFKAVERLLAAGRFRRAETVGKIVALDAVD